VRDQPPQPEYDREYAGADGGPGLPDRSRVAAERLGEDYMTRTKRLITVGLASAAFAAATLLTAEPAHADYNETACRAALVLQLHLS
jgi:hypothetical protein